MVNLEFRHYHSKLRVWVQICIFNSIYIFFWHAHICNSIYIYLLSTFSSDSQYLFMTHHWIRHYFRNCGEIRKFNKFEHPLPVSFARVFKIYFFSSITSTNILPNFSTNGVHLTTLGTRSFDPETFVTKVSFSFIFFRFLFSVRGKKVMSQTLNRYIHLA